jgi:hypothetical protein
VVRHDVDDDPDAGCVQRVDERVEVGESAQPLVDVAIVGHVVATVGEWGRIERTEPHRVDVQ